MRKKLIPDITTEVLKFGFGHLGVASKQLRTRHIDTYGTKFSNTDNTITCFIEESNSADFIKFLKETKRVSFFVALLSHESYNFKGKFLFSSVLKEEDLQITKIYLENAIKNVKSLGLPDELVEKAYNKSPDLAITFEVQKVFVQTPGPNAGNEIK